MDTGLDQDKTELAVHVLAVTLKVLADGDGLGIYVNTRLFFKYR